MGHLGCSRYCHSGVLEILQLDFSEVGTSLLRTLARNHPGFVITEVGETATDIGQLLYENVDVELIHELMPTMVGQGMLIGILTSYYDRGESEEEGDHEKADLD